MTTQSIPFPTLADTLWEKQGLMRPLILAIAGAALLTLSARLKIPFYPVPMTMQTFVVLGLGMIYGWKLGASTVILYLALGAFGLPVFAGTPEKGLGLAYMAGPTGGYLLGFALAVIATGYLAEKGWDRKISGTFLAMLVGNVIIYIPGLTWLGQVVGWDKPILAWGMTPFLFGDLAKIVLAMIILPMAWKRLGGMKKRQDSTRFTG